MLVWMSYREVANGISRSNEDTKDQSSIGQTQNIITQILVLNTGKRLRLRSVKAWLLEEKVLSSAIVLLEALLLRLSGRVWPALWPFTVSCLHCLTHGLLEIL